MSSIDRERLGELLERAIGLPHEARTAFVDAECSSEPELRAELLRLLESHARAPAPLERLAVDVLLPALEAVSGLPATGRTVAQYRIEALVGSGGMGVVYKAYDLKLGRHVALKFLRADVSGDAQARARLESEARAASALDHPNIGVVHEIGAVELAPGDERLFIAMTYYEGETLRRKIDRGPMSVPETVRCARQVAAGLARAHEAGIVHRDVKPGNVIVTDRGDVKIVDFGVARTAGSALTQSGATLGTVAYMSPEHTRGLPADQRSDLWSFGVMLYEMLTARRPFRGADDAVVIHAIRHDEPEPITALRPDVPPALVHVVMRCLEKDPDARFAESAEVAAALETIDANGAVRPRRSVRRPRALAAALVAAAVLAGAAFLAVDELRMRAGVDEPAVVSTPAPRIAVLPATPAVADAELAALGRELSAMLATGLDGIGELRTVDAATTLAAVPAGASLTIAEARAVARSLDAQRVVHGVLLHSGDELRLDLVLHETDGRDALASASVTVRERAALADAAIIALLDDLWRREPPAVPSLAAATRTQVPDARRAYLAGEIALARLDMPAALAEFERAFAADPTFWWAYWRSLYPRVYQDANVPPDSELVRQAFAHRAELPEPDRLLVETFATRSRVEQLERLAVLTERFPSYSPGWWQVANTLVHWGPYLGRPAEHARFALERFIALEPRFAPAWDHALWVAVIERDAAAAERAAAEARRLVASVPQRAPWLTVLELRAAVAAAGGIPAARLGPAADFVLTSPAYIAEGLSVGFVADGFPTAQLELNRAVRERVAADPLAGARWRGDALAWVARGDFASGLEAADRWARADGGGRGALGAYGLAVAAAAWGGAAAEEAVRRRPAGSAGYPADEQAQLAWLDGVLAYLQRDGERIAAARAALPTAAAHRSALDRSLEALAAHAAGEVERAARELAALEHEIADRGAVLAVGNLHPLLATADRLFAASWLRQLGDDDEALRLLAWHEAIPGPALLQAWNTAVGGIALVDRGEIAESAGDLERARAYFERFAAQYDRIGGGMQPLADRAAAGLERLRAGR
jgi:TolB-like protein